MWGFEREQTPQWSRGIKPFSGSVHSFVDGLVKRMHRVPFITRSSHVMASTARVYAAHSDFLLSTSCRPVTTKPQVFSITFTRSLYVDAWYRSYDLRRQNLIHIIGPRHLSWFARTNSKSVESNSFSQSQEEDAKAAILDKVMKGRQPTDLMLRCE
jgi:hypothetical protein